MANQSPIVVFVTSDQKAENFYYIAQEIMPDLRVPETLPSDQTTNLLSCLMQRCRMLDQAKLIYSLSSPPALL